MSEVIHGLAAAALLLVAARAGHHVQALIGGLEELGRLRRAVLVDPESAARRACEAQAARRTPCSLEMRWLVEGEMTNVCTGEGLATEDARFRPRRFYELTLDCPGPLPKGMWGHASHLSFARLGLKVRLAR